VVHVSRTPLVGAPGKLVSALNRFTSFQASLIVGQDYPSPLAGLFLDAALLPSGKGPLAARCRQLLREADLIHVHNDLNDDLKAMVQTEARSECRFVYQAHSPLREGPLYFDRAPHLGLDFSAQLAIPHHAHRFFPQHELVPNVVMLDPGVRPILRGERPRVLFSPSHDRTGQRWGDKVSKPLGRVLTGLHALGLAEVIEVRGMAPHALAELRRSTHLTIDEIVTGAYHQVSLEGLATGNVVVNDADDFSLMAFQAACEIDENPPFYRTCEQQAGDRLLSLLLDVGSIARLQQDSYDFFMAYLRPERLIGRFARIYERVLQ
jgi:hypothetical protein